MAGRRTSEPAAFRPCSSRTAFVIAPSTLPGSLTFTAHQHSARRLVWQRLPAHVTWYNAMHWRALATDQYTAAQPTHNKLLH